MTERRGLISEMIVRAIERGGTVRVHNVLNALLWLCAVTAPTCLFFTWLLGSSTIVGLVLTAVAVLPILLAMAMYVWFALKDPDRLQSEAFVLHHRELELRRRDGVITDKSEMAPIADPSLQLSPHTEREENNELLRPFLRLVKDQF